MSIQFELLRRYARRACVGRHAGEGDLDGSWLGDARLGLPGEPWPMGQNGPLEAIAQINVASLPYRPPHLEGLALITVFLDWNDEGFVPAFDDPFPPNGNGWLLRAYSSLAGLEPLRAPISKRCDSTAIRWEVIEADYPKRDDVQPADLEAFEAAGLKWRDHFSCAEGFKVGGWPSVIQSEIYWAPWNKHPARPDFAFQIDTDLDLYPLMFGDGGCCYFGRGERGYEHEWAFECQFF